MVDDFGIKYVEKNSTDALLWELRDKYEITTDWNGSHYCGMTLEWDQIMNYVYVSVTGYVENSLPKYQNPAPTHLTHSPIEWTDPIYVHRIQLTTSRTHIPNYHQMPSHSSNK